jgi:hypothetical protein
MKHPRLKILDTRLVPIKRKINDYTSVPCYSKRSEENK